jgi:pilus assembly protein Flp/PilA
MFRKILAMKETYFHNEEGATAIEYGLIAAGISLAILGAVFTFGNDLRDLFGTMNDSIGTAADNVDTGTIE